MSTVFAKYTGVNAPSRIELFLSPAQTGGQTLAHGLTLQTLTKTPSLSTSTAAAQSFLDPGGNAQDLRDQGWAVIVPQGAEGDRLLALTEPLLERRAEDQDSDSVDVYFVPPDMTTQQALQWVEDKLVGNRMLDTIPGYVCILGRPEQVSLELQQVLSTSMCVGRLGFDHDLQYEAYADKVVRWESQPESPSAQALFFTSKDGTRATDLGHRHLIMPSFEDLRQKAERFPIGEPQIFFDVGPQNLLTTAQLEQPGFLMTCSHGRGAPKGGWPSLSHQRMLQGSLCLGPSEHLTAEDIARTPFLPGGIWFMFACFGAGTPHQSNYYPWLKQLHRLDEYEGDLEPLLTALPRPNEPPFLAALPQAALANPEGPLAIIGHLDLAWTYSFQELTSTFDSHRHRRFQGMVQSILRGRRTGLAFADLRRVQGMVQTDLTHAADRTAAENLPASEAEQIRLGHRWMLHHDLQGYVLLGDPATRLRVTPSRRREDPVRPMHAVSTPALTPSLSTPVPLEDMEAAVHAMIAGDLPLKALERQYRVDRATLKIWEESYLRAGRQALAGLQGRIR